VRSEIVESRDTQDLAWRGSVTSGFTNCDLFCCDVWAQVDSPELRQRNGLLRLIALRPSNSTYSTMAEQIAAIAVAAKHRKSFQELLATRSDKVYSFASAMHFVATISD
jgi:hypothetical protein